MDKIVKDILLLRQKSDFCSKKESKNIFEQLKLVMKFHDNCLGLAAIQLGIKKRASIYKRNNESSELVELLNPTIIKKEVPIIYKQEGCASFPGQYHDTKRFKIITVKDDIHGERKVVGMEAIIVQHEIDHMDGVLFFDRKQQPIERTTKKVGRNDPCPCGSGKKYKKCCGNL